MCAHTRRKRHVFLSASHAAGCCYEAFYSMSMPLRLPPWPRRPIDAKAEFPKKTKSIQTHRPNLFLGSTCFLVAFPGMHVDAAAHRAFRPAGSFFIYAYIHRHTYTGMCIHRHTHLGTHTYAHTHTQASISWTASTHRHPCIGIDTQASMQRHTYTCGYTQGCIHGHPYIGIHASSYTHRHMHMGMYT
jgi:hypothetical protein